MECCTLCYLGILLVFDLIVGIRYFQNSINLTSRCLLILCGSLPICYYLVGGLTGIVVFSIVCRVVYQSLPVPQLAVNNKAVIITGCDSGFGHATAKYLDSLGFTVFAGCYLKGGDGEIQLVSDCSDKLTTLQLDVTKDDQIQEALRTVKDKLKGQDLWGLVNNAGTLTLGSVEVTPISTYQRLWDVNFLGGVRMSKTFLPLIRRSKGRVVNIASVGGRVPVINSAAYCVSKAAVEMASDILRQEMDIWGVHVSIIEPGTYLTGIGNPANVKPFIQSLCDSASEEIKQDYDFDRFASYYQKKLETRESVLIKEFIEKDITPVVMSITDALMSKRPKSRYLIGTGTAIYMFIIGVLPTFIIDTLSSYVMIPKSARDSVLQPRRK